ncbi:hypothetical protein U1Q18_026377 [Sarracenia purpurea var. burkii]
MAVATAVHGGYIHSKFRLAPTTMSAKTTGGNRKSRRPPPPPIFVSTNPSHVNPHQLRDLYSLCNHSCHRFPIIDSDGRAEPVEVAKLGIALSHSSVVVSVFSKPDVVTYHSSSSSNLPNSSVEFSDLSGVGGDWLRRVVSPVTPSNGQLVGFGRAVSDYGLTASIYDVVVIPSLRRMGIGTMIVKRITRLVDTHFETGLCSVAYVTNASLLPDSEVTSWTFQNTVSPHQQRHL